MLAHLVLLAAAAIAPVCRAASATIFPVALGPEANLQGEIIGSGGDVGTTYVLSGETRGIAFTLTLAEDATHVVERVSIPTRSFDLSVDCAINIRSGSAVCENFIVSGGVSSTLATTLPFSPFAVPVSTLGVVASSTDTTVPESTSGGGTASATESTLGGETTGLGAGSSSESAVSSSTSVAVGVTSTPSPSAPSSIASTPSSISTLPSELSSQSAILGASASSIPTSSTATSPSPSPSAPATTATLASPSAAQSESSTSGASRGHFAPSGVVLVFAFVVISWVLV